MGLSRDPIKRQAQLANLVPNKGRPARGEARGLKHGGRASARFLPVQGKSRQIYDLLAADAPLRDHDGELPAADRVAVELLALALARLESVSHWLEMHGLLDSDGNPRPAVELESKLRKEAAGHADALALSPRSRVALGLDLLRSEIDWSQHLRSLEADDGQ